MNFDTLEFDEIAAKLRSNGWAIKYIWSGERDAFGNWLSERHGIKATGVDGGYSFWIVDDYWEPPATARSIYDAWYNFGFELEIDPELTPERVGFQRRDVVRG
ncbi:hypothetical protein CN085_10670 [Sinorhizobium meliloti]|uniref:hypothetical protein n=1 Tax=Rhizobium meliloti TaxID=382 RepID=UPI000FDA0318|nr:hypothetical protein [Sinorhizobium meliloti]RVP15554.1 hypothetical protein CN085_10670 [Sinorhizobium meliloti]